MRGGSAEGLFIKCMSPKEFYDNVVKMREAQKAYFKFRTSAELAKSKHLEKLIDNEIARVKKLEEERNNPTLFK